MGRARLAYPIRGHKKGSYLLTFFKSEGANVKAISDDCRLSEVILRELILKVYPKLVDHLMTQAMSSNPNVEAEDERGEEEQYDRPRRRRDD